VKGSETICYRTSVDTVIVGLRAMGVNVALCKVQFFLLLI